MIFIEKLNVSITEDQQVFNHTLGRLIKQFSDKDGYKICKIQGKMRKVHRLVALAYYGESDLLVNHINGIKYDNRPCNLEYVTTRQDAIHAIDLGLVNFKVLKENNEKVKIFSDEDIRYIRSTYGNSENYGTLAKKFNVSMGVIFQIVTKKTYKEII